MSLNYKRQDTDDGAAFLIGTDDDAFVDRLKQAADTATETPTPSGEDDERDGGPIQRFTNVFSPLSMGVLERLGLNGHEIANDVRTRVHELYRNEFPVLKPRFERKCTACEAEYDERVDECRECGGDVREPDVAEKRAAEHLVESVNKEGQSLREVAESCEFDQWFNGVPIIVIRHEYTIAENGELLKRDPTEIVKGDPKRIVPVVDGNRRIGGYWWVCPRCRGHEKYEPEASAGQCEACNAALREVYFAEYGEGKDSIEAYYFEEEVLTFPWAFPRMHGLDGLAPTHHNWLKQLIIDFQDRYAGAFYDPESDRLPNQFIVLHTTNPDAWESRLQSAREGAKEDVYDSPIFTNQYNSTDNTVPEVQVVDAMPDELLGQNQDLRETYKKDIRQSIGISDVHDSDLSEAGGLNNEGLQLEVTDRSLATQMHDYTEGWLDELAKRLGIQDWKFGYIPSAGVDAEDLQQEIEAGVRAEEAGLDARMADGQVEVADGELETDPGPAAGSGEDGSGESGGTDLVQKAGNWMTVNEGREKLGLPPVDGEKGDDFGAPGRVGAMDVEGDGDPEAPEGEMGNAQGAASEGSSPGRPVAPTDDGGDHSRHDYGPTLSKANPEDLAAATETLFQAHEHMIFPDLVEQKAEEPFWNQDEDMPEFVRRLINEALQGGAIRRISDSLPSGTTRSDVRQFFQGQLSEGEWSLRGLTENYANRFGVSEAEAETAVRTQTASVLNEAREEGYRAQGDVDDREFKWIGPDDARTTEMCEVVKDATNPDHGGDPRTLEELKNVVMDARRDHFPDFDGPATVGHYNCRHTYVEHFD